MSAMIGFLGEFPNGFSETGGSRLPPALKFGRYER
jgi:hypothetical protein